MPFDRRANPGRLPVELAGIEAHRAPQILQHLGDFRMPRGAGILRMMEMRRLDAPHPRLGCRVRIFEVVNLVIGGDGARVAHEFLGDAAQRLDLVLHEDVRHHDEPVAAVCSKIGGRQHDSS